MFKSSTDKIAKSVIDSYNFEKISDLTKEQFTEILSKSMCELVNSSDFIKEIDKKLGQEMKMSMRAREIR